MKPWLVGVLGTIAVVAVGTFVFRAQLTEALADSITENMFLPQDQDGFDPGVAVGQVLPPIRAVIDGREVTGIGEWAGARGTVFVVNRSVDW